MGIDLKETKKKLEEARRLQEQYEVEILKAELHKKLETFCDEILKNRDASEFLKTVSKDEVKIIANEVAMIIHDVAKEVEPKLQKLRATKEAKALRRNDVAMELNLNTDVDELYSEIERLEQAKKKEELKKKKLLNQIISLDPEDNLYDTLYEDLSNCLQEFTRNIAEIDGSMAKTKISIEGVKSKQLSFMTIDELKAFTKTVFTEMPDAAKKEFMNYIIESIEIFPEKQKNGR